VAAIASTGLGAHAAPRPRNASAFDSVRFHT
jgi:hypothetical protein